MRAGHRTPARGRHLHPWLVRACRCWEPGGATASGLPSWSSQQAVTAGLGVGEEGTTVGADADAGPLGDNWPKA